MAHKLLHQRNAENPHELPKAQAEANNQAQDPPAQQGSNENPPTCCGTFWNNLFDCVTCAVIAQPPLDQEKSISHSVTANDDNATGLLPVRAQNDKRMTLVLDLDETLVHSSFKPTEADIVLNVELEGELHHIYVCKRPGCDEFLAKVCKLYEVVIFTASLSLYADPLMDQLDPKRLIATRLFRESCVQQGPYYVKDLSRLGRNMARIVLVDDNPMAYSFQPENAIPINGWFADPDDRELIHLLPLLEQLSAADDLRPLLGSYFREQIAQQ